jgi:ferredoxin
VRSSNSAAGGVYDKLSFSVVVAAVRPLPFREEARKPRDNWFESVEERCETMAYIIAEPCIGTKDTACVDSCPVDCIHPKDDEDDFEVEEMLYIDPEECIDCGACVPVCPVSAIFAEEDLPEEWLDFTEINAEYFEAMA